MIMPSNPNWKMRRRTVIVSLLFCAWAIAYTMLKTYGVKGCEDSRVAETVITMAFGAAVPIIGSYVFGATWDDKNKLQAKAETDASDSDLPK